MNRRQRRALLPAAEMREYAKPQEARAYELLTFLETNTNGADAKSIIEALGWSRSQFDGALDCARNLVCPQLLLAIPHPVPEDGWCYHLTGEWVSADRTPAIAAGTGHAMARIESRLRSVLRDAQVAREHLDPHSLDGRKVNLLTLHLSHMLRQLTEIVGE